MHPRVLLVASAILAAPVGAAPTIHAITPVLEGHLVGGVTLDAIGNLFVADFGESVLKITPEGERREFASGLYGASGNAIDRAGNLLQSNFYGHSVVKLDRAGKVLATFATSFKGPVGIAPDPLGDAFFVADCQANAVMRVDQEGTAAVFATNPQFKCPNGMAFGNDGHLFVVNFRDDAVFDVAPDGTVKLFARVSGHGLGHLCFKKDRFYLTAFASHSIYELTLDGKSRRILGTGERGLVDGDPTTARLSFPNGIACDPYRPRLFINEYVAESPEALPRRAVVRRIDLE